MSPKANPKAAQSDADPITAAVTATLDKVNEPAKTPDIDTDAILADVKTGPKASEVPVPVEAVRAPEIKPAGSEVILDPDLPRGELEARLLELRDPPKVEIKPPPLPTEKQWAQTEREMAAGRKRVEYFRELERQRPKPEPNPRDGHNVEVRRDGAYVHENRTNKVQAV